MGIAPEIDILALKHVCGVVGMKRIDLRVFRASEIVRVVTRNRLADEAQSHQQDATKMRSEEKFLINGWETGFAALSSG